MSLRHDYAADLSDWNREHAVRLARVPNAAVLLAALAAASWSDSLIDARVQAYEVACRASGLGIDMEPEEVTSYFGRCGLGRPPMSPTAQRLHDELIAKSKSGDLERHVGESALRMARWLPELGDCSADFEGEVRRRFDLPEVSA